MQYELLGHLIRISETKVVIDMPRSKIWDGVFLINRTTKYFGKDGKSIAKTDFKQGDFVMVTVSDEKEAIQVQEWDSSVREFNTD
jgi:hypothetical protein